MSNDLGGVWRTVGGRHIFIKDGDDLATAMKKSGKFKDKERLKKKIGNDVKKLQEEADKKGMLPSELQDELGIKDSELRLKDKYTEDFENEMQNMERYLKAEEAKKETKYENYYKKEHLGKPSSYKKGDKIEFDNGYFQTIKGEIIREATEHEKKYNINSNLKGYIVRDEHGFEYIVADTKIKKR